MTPATRRAFHQALDIVLDALAEEQRAEPKKRTRSIERQLPPMPDATPEELAAVDRQLGRAGYKVGGK